MPTDEFWKLLGWGLLIFLVLAGLALNEWAYGGRR
jgi:hypothetical protein